MPRQVKWTNTLLHGVDDKVIGTTGIGEDITDQKRTEQLLIQGERLKAIGDLAGGVAHNFNNLLQMVMGGIDLALIDMEMGDQIESKKTLQRVLESAKFGAETVRRLQSFAQVRAETQPSGSNVFDLSATVHDAIEMTKPLWKGEPEKAGIRIALNSDLAEGCLVSAKESEIFEVLVNLVKNAAEALTRGGNIWIKTSIQDDQVILWVMDDGMGIRSENLKKVFEPFWTTKGVSVGTGMGLAVSHGIINRHGGTISVESEEGKNTTFTIRLPLAKEPKETVTRSAETILRLKLNVLVIDDMIPIVMLMKQILTRHEQTVFSATSGEDALEIFRNNKIDLVISDLGMPGMNGWEVGKAVRTICQERGIPKTPFILLTGWGEQTLEQEKIVESGVDAVVTKPLNIGRLMLTISDVIETFSKKVQTNEPI